MSRKSSKIPCKFPASREFEVGDRSDQDCVLSQPVAAKRLGLTEVPAVTIADLDEAKLRMLRLALNRLGEDSGWDLDALKLEFSDILEISSEIDLRISGFEMGEIDVAFA